MLTVSSAQLDAWLAVFLFPLSRVLGLFAIAPLLGSNGIPVRIRLVAGFAVTLAMIPALPAMPPVAAGSWLSLAIVGEQVFIGVLLGFVMRIVFAAFDLAGELTGLQMGLSFAVFYNPTTAAQTPIVSEFFGLLAILLYLALDGHLLSLALLAKSFHLLPVAVAPVSATVYSAVTSWASIIFSAGLLLSLPMLAALLIANIAMGVLSRVAPQLNLFAVGFPVTMLTGFAVIGLAIPYLGDGLQHLFEQGFSAMGYMMKVARQ